MRIVLKQPVKSPAVITNGFGDTTIDYSRFALKGHNGIDYAGNLGDPIFAMADGRVEKIAYDPKGWGHHIVLRHDGFRTLYSHLKRATVFRGDLISAEKQIAEMGYSGFVDPPDERGTHLHIGLIFDNADKNNGYGGYVDPLEYIRFSDQELESIGNQLGISAEPAPAANSSGYVRVVSSLPANVRMNPGLMSATVKQLQPGTTVPTTGKTERNNNLTWREVLIPFWVAESDPYGDRILEDVQ